MPYVKIFEGSVKKKQPCDTIWGISGFETSVKVSLLYSHLQLCDNQGISGSSLVLSLLSTRL